MTSSAVDPTPEPLNFLTVDQLTAVATLWNIGLRPNEVPEGRRTYHVSNGPTMGAWCADDVDALTSLMERQYQRGRKSRVAA
jgi:hypothetical protein